jgi:DNA-binding XRE family transcriptional regulator
VSNRQYWYLKQKYAREEAAWRAFLDVTGQTYAEWEDESFEPSYLEREGDTSFEPAKL